jgi:hypothetical protein
MAYSFRSGWYSVTYEDMPGTSLWQSGRTRKSHQMKTTLDVPLPLIEETRRLSGERTKTRAVIVALEEFIRRKRLERLFQQAARKELRLDGVDHDRMRHER